MFFQSVVDCGGWSGRSPAGWRSHKPEPPIAATEIRPVYYRVLAGKSRGRMRVMPLDILLWAWVNRERIG